MHLFLVLNTNLEYLSELCTASYCHNYSCYCYVLCTCFSFSTIGTSPSISHWLLACSICTYLWCSYCLLHVLCNKTDDADDDDDLSDDECLRNATRYRQFTMKCICQKGY